MKEKLKIEIKLYKNDVLTDWTEYRLGSKKPNKIIIIKRLIEFIEETIDD
jgi:hypothetical protein